jgi:TPP-dependent pyruvate/acetoin dehydrogenase alpha subunit
MEFNKSDLLLLYSNLVQSRRVDEALLELHFGHPSNRAFTPHSGIGQEAVGVGACTFLRPDDYAMRSHRGLAHAIAKGTPMGPLLAGLFCRRTGLCKGKGGGHACYWERGVVSWQGVVGSSFPMAAGLAFAAKQRGHGQVVVSFFGDGAAQRGTLHEAMNWVSLRKLPVVWVCENNGYFVTTSVKDAFAAENIADLAPAYSMPGEIVDGQDVLAVCRSVLAAVERARKGEGPTLIECKTYRFRPHEEKRFAQSADDKDEFRSEEVMREMLARDPVKLFREHLLATGFQVTELDELDRRAEAEVHDALEFALASPYPEPAEAWDDLYAA